MTEALFVLDSLEDKQNSDEEKEAEEDGEDARVSRHRKKDRTSRFNEPFYRRRLTNSSNGRKTHTRAKKQRNRLW